MGDAAQGSISARWEVGGQAQAPGVDRAPEPQVEGQAQAPRVDRAPGPQVGGQAQAPWVDRALGPRVGGQAQAPQADRAPGPQVGGQARAPRADRALGPGVGGQARAPRVDRTCTSPGPGRTHPSHLLHWPLPFPARASERSQTHVGTPEFTKGKGKGEVVTSQSWGCPHGVSCLEMKG